MIIPKAKKKNKKRHMTITSSHPAVLEAITRHQARQENRSLPRTSYALLSFYKFIKGIM
jgi:hypothetical protein